MKSLSFLIVVVLFLAYGHRVQWSVIERTIEEATRSSYEKEKSYLTIPENAKIYEDETNSSEEVAWLCLLLDEMGVKLEEGYKIYEYEVFHPSYRQISGTFLVLDNGGETYRIFTQDNIRYAMKIMPEFTIIKWMLIVFDIAIFAIAVGLS